MKSKKIFFIIIIFEVRFSFKKLWHGNARNLFFFFFLLFPPTLGYGHIKSDFGSVPFTDLVRLKT